MNKLTIALIVIATILLTINVIIDISHGNLSIGYLIDGFGSFEPTEPIFLPEGYGNEGQIHNFITMPIAHRIVAVDGVPLQQLRKEYPVLKTYKLFEDI